MGEQTEASARRRTGHDRLRLRWGGAAAFVVAVTVASLVAGGAAEAMTTDAGGPDRAPVTDPELAPVVSRIAGADRYDLSAEIAKKVSPTATNVVYLASGAAFSDALSAGPAAAVSFAPLLLVAPDALPPSVATSLIRLDPIVIKVIGGPASVSDGVLATVRTLMPRAAVTRISGSDRYAVSRAVVSDAFTGGAAGVMIATGRDFPDALSAGAIAGGNGMPVILVDGAAPTADVPTQTLVHTLGAGLAVVVGGPTSVSTGIEGTILTGGWVPRVSGANRYEVSLNLAEFSSPDYSTVYLATGANFPDALAGGILAAKTHSPMFVVPPDCVPKGVLAQIASRGTKNVVLLGGSASLSPAVATLTACSF
ncbi:cell wall-binding repeat-containing protein [Herbiconiux sp. UC225_62]|uniref:cell wall-binding repeat-containing protein n=1 Tax=Herbiconiux sp. UC225_62 TaxID=3350168 RepID=UPI0036D2A39B